MTTRVYRGAPSAIDWLRVGPSILLQSGWSGYAEADPLVLGILVAAVAALAVGYVASRLWPRGVRRGGRR